MRLKSIDGPLAVHNGNILNSPKRINTLQNSNITAILTAQLSSELSNTNINSNALISTSDITELNTINNVNIEDTVQWCNPALAQNRELSNNEKNSVFNINNTLAASLGGARYATASSVCSESSPDDSLLDYEEAPQSCSSTDASPQDEDRGFDISDSESLSIAENLNVRDTFQHRGIVNPNYPGFQHLAHTLDYSIKASSDTDLTDDDLEFELTKSTAEATNINNNNEDEFEYQIDSVNRLDSVENIQKVFHDKPVFNIPLEFENLIPSNDSEEVSGTIYTSNQNSDDDLAATGEVHFNIPTYEAIEESRKCIIGDLGKEITEELEKLNCNSFEPSLVYSIEVELKEALEKLSTSNDLQPSCTKYTIEPNTQEPFNKFVPPLVEITIQEVEPESQTAAQSTQDLSAMSVLQMSASYNSNIPELESLTFDSIYNDKTSDSYLSGVYEKITVADLNANPNLLDTSIGTDNCENRSLRDSNRDLEELEEISKSKQLNGNKQFDRMNEEIEKSSKEDKTKDDIEKDDDTVIPRKKEKMESNYIRKRRDYSQQYGSLITVSRRDLGGRNRDSFNKRSAPVMRDKKKILSEPLGGFDVYNIETAMPKIDLEAIESHLRAAREEERRRRTDREEIRRRLAMGSEEDYYNDRPGRKPSLQARLQSGMNLQICFMNETASDTDSPNSDSECPMTNPKEQKMSPKIKKSPLSQTHRNLDAIVPVRPATLSLGQPLLQPVNEPLVETDFFTRQARLQTEARMALAQAKEMARMQMQIERQKHIQSPITEMVRHSLEKVGIPFPEERRRLSRQILTEMNVAQLQVIVNDLHTQIEILNEALVKLLMDRDDLHMEQDSMLVDIEDLTRYLGAKEQTFKEHSISIQNNNISSPSPPRSPLAALNSSVKPHLHRIANLVKK